MGWDEVKYRWTSEDAANAATAKAAKGTDPLPKVLVTPYGLSPFQFHTDGTEGGQVVIKTRVYLASDADAKKPLEAWDIAVGAEVMLPLELARFGEPRMRDRFFKKGQEWIPLPEGVKGSTLLELCESLYATGQPQLDVYHFFSKTKPGSPTVSKTQAELDADAPVRDRILSKLVGHWQNTDYHFEQAAQGLPVNGNLALPLKSATLQVVLAEPPPPAPAAPAAPQGESGSAPGTGAALKTGTTPGGADPPTPYDKLPDPLKAKLVRSYQDRQDAVPGSEKNLDAYWGKSASTRNVWELLNQSMDWQDINTMTRVYQRMEAVDKTGALWRDHVLYLVRAYTGGVYALEMVYTDRGKLRTYLDSDVIKRTDTPRLARGVRWTQCMHTNTDGWREVSETDSLHINVANIENYPSSEDTHIDETSFTDDRDDDGKSGQAWTSGPLHFAQSQLRWMDIERPFWNLDQILQKPEEERPAMKPETAATLKAWADSRGNDAVTGEDGHKKALDLWHQVQDDVVKLQPETGG